jgi:hypothetical protein
MLTTFLRRDDRLRDDGGGSLGAGCKLPALDSAAAAWGDDVEEVVAF